MLRLLEPAAQKTQQALEKMASDAQLATGLAERLTRAMGTVSLGTVPVKRQCMLGNIKAALFGNPLLAFFDFFVVKLFHPAAIEANEMVMVGAFVQLEYRLAGFKMIPVKQTCLLELRQHTIDRCQADIHIFGQQDLVDVLGAQVAHLTILENIENLESRQGGFQTAGFQLGWGARHVVSRI